MKQKAGMVLCVLFGAALVMMCDSDGVDRVRGAVQDMVDGEEAQAAWEAGSAATTSELAGFTCPQGTALVESITVGDPGGGCVLCDMLEHINETDTRTRSSPFSGWSCGFTG